MESYDMTTCALCGRRSICINGMCEVCYTELNDASLENMFLEKAVEIWQHSADEHCKLCGSNLDETGLCMNPSCGNYLPF